MECGSDRVKMMPTKQRWGQKSPIATSIHPISTCVDPGITFLLVQPRPTSVALSSTTGNPDEALCQPNYTPVSISVVLISPSRKFLPVCAPPPPGARLSLTHVTTRSIARTGRQSCQVLETKLRYAISNCRAMDADDTSVGRTAAGLGWGEDP